MNEAQGTSAQSGGNGLGEGEVRHLIGHDEGAPDIAVLHQALSVGQAQNRADLDGCRPSAVRHRHNAIDVPVHLPALHKMLSADLLQNKLLLCQSLFCIASS